MKKTTIYSLAIFVSILFSCEKEGITTNNDLPNNSEIRVEYDYKSELKRDFAKALVSSMKDNIELRQFIKDEALKMFDKDYDILYLLVKDEKISNSKSFRDILIDHFEDKNRLSEIENNLPLLTIFVPELPEDSFSASKWNVQNEIPEVAIRLTTTNHVPMFRSDNTDYILEGGLIPGFPVIVIKENERVMVSNLNTEYNKSIKGSILKNSANTHEFIFLDDVFNNSINSLSSHTQKTVSTLSLDQKLIDAYNIYNNNDGWQRDYIYYNLTPTNTKDQFQYDFQEHITHFSLNGDAMAVYSKISDQTGDPKYKTENWYGYLDKPKESPWTGGAFEFKVRVLINAQNGLGTEYITYFPAGPRELFDVHYKYTFPTNVPGPRFYRVDYLTLKTMPLNLPIFNWDLNQYAASIKIEIEEVDLTVTTVLTDSRTVKFANNFSIDGGILKKIGLKFGSSLETTSVQTVQKTFTEGNDQLGSVIINFADDIILSKTTSNSVIRDYSSGWFILNLVPVRVQ